MNMKRILTLLLALVFAVTVTACGSSDNGSQAGDAAQESAGEDVNDNPDTDTDADEGDADAAEPVSGNFRSIEEIQASGELIMLTNAAFPPFEYVEGTEAMGVDVDVARAIAQDLGVELNVVDMEFDGLIVALKSGRGDLIAAGMTITADRQENVDFTLEYVTSAQYMIVAADSELATLEDLAGLRIGVQTGTTGDFLVTDAIEEEDGELYGTGATVSNYRSALEAALDLNNGRLDAVVIDGHPARAIAAQNEGLKVVEEAISESEAYAIAVDKGNAELLSAANETLQRLMDEGTVEEFLVNHTTNDGSQAPAAS